MSILNVEKSAQPTSEPLPNSTSKNPKLASNPISETPEVTMETNILNIEENGQPPVMP